MDLEEIRARIDALDERIVELLNERARLALEIGALKRGQGLPIYAPEREQRIHERLAELSDGPLDAEGLRAVYNEIMSACRALEQEHRAAFLGPEGTFTHQAARRQFGASSAYVPVSSIRDVFAEVSRGGADHGVVPIENSSEGGIGETLDAFIEFNVKVCSEIYVRIHHNLMAKCPAGDIRHIYSKGVVFGQCRSWLAQRFPHADLIETGSTTHAARLAANEPESAAIGNREAAAIYGLEIIHAGIEDSPHNATRFLVLGGDSSEPTGRDKTSILCFIKDEVGALFSLLEPFREAALNLTKIESWPSKRRAWHYCFFIDFQGHVSDSHVQDALVDVGRHCSELKLLGSYPRALETEKA